MVPRSADVQLNLCIIGPQIITCFIFDSGMPLTEVLCTQVRPDRGSNPCPPDHVQYI